MIDDETPEKVNGQERLPAQERERFEKALALLRSGRGVVGLTEGPDGLAIRGLGVYEALLARSWEVRYNDPQEMRHLAKVAVEMCFDPEVYGEERVVDLQARAWGELGNAYRVGNLYPEARDAFYQAFNLLQHGTGDRRLLRRLLDLETSLLGSQGDYNSALQRLTILTRQYREEGNEHMAGRTLVTRALYTCYNSQPEQALQTLSEALKLIDQGRDPDLMMVASFDEILFMVDCGRCEEARITLFKKRLWLAQGGRLAQVKLRGIEGRIAYGLGELENAEMILREARADLEEVGLPVATALATLELATTLMALERKDEAVREGLASAEMFIALSANREILANVLLLKDTLLDGTANVESMEWTASELRRKLMALGWK